MPVQATAAAETGRPRARAGRPESGLRTRTSIALLAALLLAGIVIAGQTIQLLKNQRTVLEETIRESQAQAMALLANRIEQQLLAALRLPFLTMKNIPPRSVDARRFALTRDAFPEVQQVLFLDAAMGVAKALPAPRDERERRTNAWLAQRIALEGGLDQEEGFVLHTFIETIDDRPVLFGLQRQSEIERAAGWIMIRFDLELMERRLVAPLLGEFTARLGGSIALRDEAARWDDAALNWPVGRVLPGWMLEYKPALEAEAQRIRREGRLTLGVMAGVMVALLIATFAAWRELRRAHALVDLRNRFVANVSHELKTPLTLIRMYAETLYLRRVTDPERMHQYHAVLLHEAERLSQMIGTVLDFSQLRRGAALYRLSADDLRATVLGVIERYRWRVDERGLRLELRLDEALPPVPHDPDGVTQMLLNLIDNAVQHGAAGGVVAVELRALGGAAELVVADRGPGIPAGERARVREPFQRGSGADPASGSGLGLALVEEIARAHHARFVIGAPAEGSGVRAAIVFTARA